MTKKIKVTHLTIAELDGLLAQNEAGKSQAKIHDVKQIRKQLFILIKTNSDVRRLLYKYLASDKV